jgi:hypothetical protein
MPRDWEISHFSGKLPNFPAVANWQRLVAFTENPAKRHHSSSIGNEF